MAHGLARAGLAPASVRDVGTEIALGRERMLDLVALGDDLGGLRLAVDGACDRFLGGAIIVFLDFLVVGGFPMDEHADADEEIVGLVLGYDTFGDAIGRGLGHGVLRRAEHLHGLLLGLA